MNTANETQNPQKDFNPNVKNMSAGENKNTQAESPARRSGSSAASGSAKSKPVEKSAQPGGNVTSLRGGESAASKKAETKTESKSSDEETQAKKSPAFLEQIDLALVDASISIGDVVKKIDALAPKEGGIARLSKFTMGKLENVQNYLGDNSSKEIVSGAWQWVRRSPWPVGLGLLGAGIGIFVQQKTSKPEAAEKKTSQAA